MLKSTKEIEVRFNELDPLGVVWHGNYIKYFEDGRESFGQKYGISYSDLKRERIVAPVVSVKCNYKKFVRYGERLIVETRYIDNLAAKFVFDYSIFLQANRVLVAEGQTTQVFTDIEGNLILIWPDFFKEWKHKWGLTK